LHHSLAVYLTRRVRLQVWNNCGFWILHLLSRHSLLSVYYDHSSVVAFSFPLKTCLGLSQTLRLTVFLITWPTGPLEIGCRRRVSHIIILSQPPTTCLCSSLFEISNDFPVFTLNRYFPKPFNARISTGQTGNSIWDRFRDR